MKLKVLLFATTAFFAITASGQDTVVPDSIQAPADTAAVVAASPTPAAETPTPEKGHGQPWIPVALIVLLLAAVGAALAMLHKQSAKEIGALRDEIDALRADLDKSNKLIDENLKALNAKIEGVKSDIRRKGAETVKTPSPKPAFAPRQFLSRADHEGVFGRAAENFEPGNSIYEINTTDGITGKFHVIDSADVHQLALMMPTQNLTTACEGDNIHTSGGMKRIVTDQEGEAVMRGGKWHVRVKSRIHYEP